jgi:hypothetical protein
METVSAHQRPHTADYKHANINTLDNHDAS